MQTLLSPDTFCRWRLSEQSAKPQAAKKKQVIPPSRCRPAWLLLLALLAGLLAVSHGCHGDLDEELSADVSQVRDAHRHRIGQQAKRIDGRIDTQDAA